MKNLSRRSFGLGLISAPAVTSVAALPASAQGAPASEPTTSYAATVGRWRMTALLDGIAPLGREFFFGPDQAAIDATLAGMGLSGPVLPAPVTAFLLQDGDQTILIDAGMGAVPLLGPGFGGVVPALAARGVAPDDVAAVVVTHAHPDHIGGMIDASGGAVFANAEVILPEVEAGFWTDAGMRAQAPGEAQGLFDLATAVLGAYGTRVTQATDGSEILPGLVMELSPGHTPGHALIRIDGGDRQMLMIADTLHSADLHTAMPDVGFGFDTDPGQAAASRMALFDRVATDGDLIAGSHLHFPGFGRILRDGEAYRFAPATWL